MSNLKSILIILVILTVPSALALAQGDVVILKNGNRIEGTIVEEGSRHVTLALGGGGTTTLQHDEYTSIIRGKPKAEKLDLFELVDRWLRRDEIAKQEAEQEERRRLQEETRQQRLEENREAYFKRTREFTKKANAVKKSNNARKKYSSKSYSSRGKKDMFGRNVEKVKRDRERERRAKQRENAEWHKKHKINSKKRAERMKEQRVTREFCANSRHCG